MISINQVKKYCKDFENIENYEEAVSSNERWDCHHRLETHNSDDKRRLVDLSKEELKALEMYFDRPPEELIFLTVGEHTSLHFKNKKSWKKGKKTGQNIKHSEYMKDYYKTHSSPMKGKKLTEEQKEKCKSFLGKCHSEETKKKMSKNTKGLKKGKHWRLENGKRVWY